jgi:hypothetical protein
MTIWLASAGIHGEQSLGTSDDVGYMAEEQPGRIMTST